MKTQPPSHEESKLYIATLRLYRALTERATTERRALNQSISSNALRLLSHAACAGSEPQCELRQRALRYARIAVVKLFATVDAAWCERQLSDGDRALLRSLLSETLALIEGPPKDTNTAPGSAPVERPGSSNAASDLADEWPSWTDGTHIEAPTAIPDGVPIDEQDSPRLLDSFWTSVTPVGSS